MLKALTELFTDLTKSNDSHVITESDLHLVSAALMTEVILADGGTDEEEVAVLGNILTNDFNFEGADVAAFIDHARRKVGRSTSLFEFTDVVNHHFDEPEKFRLVQQLWKIARADGVIDKLEEATIRKVSDLIYLSHSSFIRAKLFSREVQ